MLALAIDPLSASTSLLARLFPVVYLGGLLALGLLISFVLRKLATVETFRQVHPWIPLLHLAVWVPLMWLVQHRFVPAATGADWWSRGLWLLVFAAAGLPWLRSVFLGVVFAVEARYKIGDDLRVGDVEGRLTGVGLRAITLRGAAGIDATVPYERLLREPVVRLNLGEHDTPCDLVLDVPAGLVPARAAELARQAAALSRYASPRRPPEVFLAPRGGDPLALQLRVRGYIYDREHDERFRSDLVERLHAALTAELQHAARRAE